MMQPVDPADMGMGGVEPNGNMGNVDGSAVAPPSLDGGTGLEPEEIAGCHCDIEGAPSPWTVLLFLPLSGMRIRRRRG